MLALLRLLSNYEYRMVLRELWQFGQNIPGIISSTKRKEPNKS